MGAWMFVVIAGACVGLGFLMILLTAQHLNSEITELTQRIEDLERELLRTREEQSESENR
jgi:Tfp pilus assembly protein PilN